MICEKSTTLKPVSRCQYCNSTSYGRGCRYAPKGVHIHASDSKKCSYCGSSNYGTGCKLNPFNNLHLHGIPYNSMISENFKNMIRNTNLLNELNRSITEYKAYELGIIDEQGRKLREPVTEDEIASYTPLIRSLLRIKKHLGSKLDLILSTSLLEGSSNTTYNTQNHKKLLSYESKIRQKIDEIFEIVNTALQDGLTLEEIDELLQK